MRARDLSALSGERRACFRQLLRPNDTSAQSLAVEPLHQKAVTQTFLGIEQMQHSRLRNARLEGRSHQRRLATKARPPERIGSPASGRPPQGQPELTLLGVDDDTVGLLTRTAREALGLDQFAEAVDALRQHSSEPRVEITHR